MPLVKIMADCRRLAPEARSLTGRFINENRLSPSTVVPINIPRSTHEQYLSVAEMMQSTRRSSLERPSNASSLYESKKREEVFVISPGEKPDKSLAELMDQRRGEQQKIRYILKNRRFPCIDNTQD